MEVYDGDKPQRATPSSVSFIIDIKDMSLTIYRFYTSKSSTTSSGSTHTPSTRSASSFIPGFNIEEDRKHSREVLENMGFENFDEFEYIVRSIS